MLAFSPIPMFDRMDHPSVPTTFPWRTAVDGSQLNNNGVDIVSGANNTTWDTTSGDINVNGGFTNSATGTDLLLGSGGKFNVVGTCSSCGSFETLPTVPAPGVFADPLAAPAVSYPTWTGATPRFAGSKRFRCK